MTRTGVHRLIPILPKKLRFAANTPTLGNKGRGGRSGGRDEIRSLIQLKQEQKQEKELELEQGQKQEQEQEQGHEQDEKQ